MFSMSTATWSPSTPTTPLVEVDAAGIGQQRRLAGGAADRRRHRPAALPRRRAPTASPANARGSVGLNVRLIEHLAPAATMMPRKQVPPVILKFGDDDSTTDGSNAAGPGVEHGGVELGALEPEQHRAEVERRQRELRRRLRTVTTARPPLPPRDGCAPGIAAAAIVSNAITWPVLDSAGLPWAPGTPVVSAPSSTRRMLPEHELGDEQVAVALATASGALARQQVGRVGDERDLAAVGVDRRRPRRSVAAPRADRAARRRRRPPRPAPAVGAATARRRSRCRRCRDRIGTPATGSRGAVRQVGGQQRAVARA